MIIGLTGGIASGKTLVADYFAELGVPVVDTDVIAREVVAPGQPALHEIEAEFGADMIAGDGSLQRRALRKLVFSDERRRRKLERILHPRIRARAFEQAATEAARSACGYVLIVIPLLFESPLQASLDRVLVVDCSVDTQVKRLTARDNETRETALRMIASQASREERLSIADDVISNDNGRESVLPAVQALHEFYQGLSRCQT